MKGRVALVQLAAVVAAILQVANAQTSAAVTHSIEGKIIWPGAASNCTHNSLNRFVGVPPCSSIRDAL